MFFSTPREFHVKQNIGLDLKSAQYENDKNFFKKFKLDKKEKKIALNVMPCSKKKSFF